MDPAALWLLAESEIGWNGGLIPKMAERGLKGEDVLHLLRDMLEEAGVTRMNFKKGKSYYIQTVTHYYVGECVTSDFSILVLKKAACVYDTGPLVRFFQEGVPSVAEPFPDDLEVQVALSPASIAVEWKHPLLRKVVGTERR